MNAVTATIIQPKVGMCAVLSIHGRAALVKFCKKLDYQLPNTPPAFHPLHVPANISTERVRCDKTEGRTGKDDHPRPTVLYLSPNAPCVDDLVLGLYFTLFVGRLHFLVQIIDLLHQDLHVTVSSSTNPLPQTIATSSRRTLENSTSHFSSATPIASGVPRSARPAKTDPTPPVPRTYLDGLPAIPSEDGNASLHIIPPESLPPLLEQQRGNPTRDDAKLNAKAMKNAEGDFADLHSPPPSPVHIQIDPCPRIDKRPADGPSYDALHPAFDFSAKNPLRGHRSPSASSNATRRMGSEGSSTNLPRSVRSRRAAAVEKKAMAEERLDKKNTDFTSTLALLSSTTVFDDHDGVTHPPKMTIGQANLKRKEVRPLMPRRKAPPPVAGEDSDPSRTSRRITSSRTVPVAEVIKTNLFPSPRPSLVPSPNPLAEPLIDTYRPSRQALELRLSKEREKKTFPPNHPVAGGPSLSLELMEVVGYRAVPLGRF